MIKKLEEVLNKRTENLINSVKNNEESAAFMIIAKSVEVLGGDVKLENADIEVAKGIPAEGVCLDVEESGFHIIYGTSLNGITDYERKVITLPFEEKVKLANILYDKVMAKM